MTTNVETEALSFGQFFAAQLGRLELRWLVVRRALASLAFWTAGLILASWLVHWHLKAVAIALGIAWGYFMIPGTLAHLMMITDVLSYALTGCTRFFPLMQEIVESGEAERRAKAMPASARRFVQVFGPVFGFAGNTSPLIGVAIWSMIVLVRMPAAAHKRTRATRGAQRAEVTRAVTLTRRIEYATIEEFADRQFQLAR